MEMVSRDLSNSGDLGLLPQVDELNFALNYAKGVRLNDTSGEANTQGRLGVLKNALSVTGASPKRAVRGG